MYVYIYIRHALKYKTPSWLHATLRNSKKLRSIVIKMKKKKTSNVRHHTRNPRNVNVSFFHCELFVFRFQKL